MSLVPRLRIHWLVPICLVWLSSIGNANAQGATDASDKTGTNPVNFQRELRLYNEFSWLNQDGSGNQNLSTLEFRTPFADGKWQFRARMRHNWLEADIDNDGIDDVEESGLGDTDVRFLTVPYLKEANAFALALEVSFDTASDDALGSGTTSLGPQAFFVKFFKAGGFGPYTGGGLFAPGLQYKFSVEEDKGRDDTNQILVDLNLLMMAEDKKSWFFTDPQIVFDLESNKTFSIVDLELGWMMTNWFNLPGHSVYVRPSFGLGGHRPTDASIEVGYKIIGW